MNYVWYGQLIRLDPSWLLESTKHADFTTSQAAATWNRPDAIGSPEYVSTCMYFRHFGHSSRQQPPKELSCGKGNDGTALRMVPDREGTALVGSARSTQALCMAQPPGIALATALWNFPSAPAGRVTAIVAAIEPKLLEAATTTTTLNSQSHPALNATFALADAGFPAWDETEHQESIFLGTIDGLQAHTSTWSNLTLVYDIKSQKCAVFINSVLTSELALQRHDNENVISYLSLRVHGPTALCVRSLSAEPTASFGGPVLARRPIAAFGNEDGRAASKM